MNPGPNLLPNVMLAPYATLQVGGPAEYFALARTYEDLVLLSRAARNNGWPVTVLGGGSNLLIADRGVKGLVIKNEIKGLDYRKEGANILVTAGSGEIWDELVQKTVERGYWGLENLSAIPGTVGATPIQNVGAYGVEVGTLVASVRAYDFENDQFVVFNNDECSFGYRDSFFKTEEGRKYLITSVTFSLSLEAAPRLSYKDLTERFGTDTSPSIVDIREAIVDIRAGKFPDWHKLGTAGSFFKNPVITTKEAEELLKQYPELPVFLQADGRVKVSLGYVLDKICNLRGVREGNVGLYEKQALVLVNHGNATAAEVELFAKQVAEKVFAKTKIQIEWEVNKI